MKFYDAFHGIGGFRLGLEALGFECVGGCENDKYAVESYKNHFGDGEVSDITKIDPKTLPDFDLLTAGFPCQAFSIAGKRKAFNDPRGELFWQIPRILKAKKPKYFILENVKGLKSVRNGDIFRQIIEALESCGYAVDWQVLNSVNFGIPQNRERIFIIGKLGGDLFYRFDWQFPKYDYKVLKDILEKDVDEKYFINAKLKDHITWKVHGKTHSRKISNKDGVKKAGFLDQSFRAGADVVEMDSLSPTLTRQPSLIKVGKMNVSGAQSGRIYSPKGIAPTLSASSGGHGSQTGLYEVKVPRIKKIGQISDKQGGGIYSPEGLHPTLISHSASRGGAGKLMIKSRVRKLTPRECFRVQGFPDSYKIIVSDSQAYKQIGNAVSVPVITAIGRNL